MISIYARRHTLTGALENVSPVPGSCGAVWNQTLIMIPTTTTTFEKKKWRQRRHTLAGALGNVSPVPGSCGAVWNQTLTIMQTTTAFGEKKMETCPDRGAWAILLSVFQDPAAPARKQAWPLPFMAFDRNSTNNNGNYFERLFVAFFIWDLRRPKTITPLLRQEIIDTFLSQF